jgi:hypothetical protein
MHSALILPIDLYGLETWRFTLRKNRESFFFLEQTAQEIYEPKKDELKRNGEYVDYLLFNSHVLISCLRQK